MSSEDDFEIYKGLADAAEKLTNTCEGHERLSHVKATSQYRRVAVLAEAHGREFEEHVPFALSERKAFLDRTHKARLALALEPVPSPNSELDEIELGEMEMSGTFRNHDQILAPARKTALQRFVAVLMSRSCAWFLLGFWAVLIISIAVPM